MTIVLIVAVVLASAVSAWIVLSSRQPNAPDFAAMLRELLVARAEGKISAEEFEERQTALHTAVLTPAPTVKTDLRLWGIPALILVGAGLYTWLAPSATQKAEMAQLPTQKSLASSVPWNTQTGPALAPQSAEPKPVGGDLNALSRRLSEKLAKDPNNGDGWLLLARSYREIRQFKEAEEAFSKAAKLLPADAALFADWADVYVMSHDRKWDAKANDLVAQALKADPKHLKALALAGSAAFDAGDYKKAAGFWKRMKAVAPADSMEAKEATANLAEAEARLGGKAKTEN
jgi:cytochrome c-type biogenesis protein CcmH